MQLNSASILTLDSSKAYYIANSTGEIKEAGLWQRFKCFTGFGDGRAKVRRLAEAVKEALLSDGGVAGETKLNDEIGRIDLTTSISGETLKTIATRFRADHADNVAKADAGRLAQSMADTYIEDHSGSGTRPFRILPTEGNLRYMKKIVAMVAKSVVGDVNANTDTEALRFKISNRLSTFTAIIDAAINLRNLCCKKADEYTKPNGNIGRSPLPLPVIDNQLTYKVFASCIIKPDGSMRDISSAIFMLMRFTPSLLTGSVRSAIEDGNVPMDLIKLSNDAFLGCFNIKGFAPELSDEHAKMIGSLRDEMRTRYGDGVGEKAYYSSFCTPKTMYANLKDVVDNATKEGRLVMANEVKDAIRAEFCRGGARLAIIKYATDYAASHDLPKPDFSFGYNIDSLNPGMVDDIAAAKTPEETLAAIKRHESKIQAHLETIKIVNDVKAKVRDSAIDRIVVETGYDRAELDNLLSTSKLANKVRLIGEEIISGKYPGSREEGFSIGGAFESVIDDFVKIRVNLLKEVDAEKGLNAAGKKAFKRTILIDEAPNAHHPGPIVNIVDSGAVTAQHFKNALGAEDDAAIADGLIQIGKTLHEKMVEIYGGEELEDAGADGRDTGFELLINKLVSEDEELVAALNAARDKIVPWLGNRNSPLKDDPVATKMMQIVYNSVLPQEG